MGSLCCVAARTHGSNTASRDWSIGPDEPFWRTNSSFSPPPPRWDIQLQSEALQYGLQDAVPLYGSSASSNSKDSRSWARGNDLYNHQYSESEGPGLLPSSPSDLSRGPLWTPLAIQEINVNEYDITTRQDPSFGVFFTRRNIERTLDNVASESVSLSSSESSESELTVKLKLSSHCNFSSLRSFMSKPIHPLSLPTFSPIGEHLNSTLTEFREFDSTTPQRDRHRWSSGSSSIDFADVFESFKLEIVNRSSTRSDGVRCGLCERFLSQRSLWSSRRIVQSSDMPIAGVISCRHVFHAECLEQSSPKTRKNDPPCPLCLKNDDNYCPDQKIHLEMEEYLIKASNI